MSYGRFRRHGIPNPVAWLRKPGPYFKDTLGTIAVTGDDVNVCRDSTPNGNNATFVTGKPILEVDAGGDGPHLRFNGINQSFRFPNTMITNPRSCTFVIHFTLVGTPYDSVPMNQSTSRVFFSFYTSDIGGVGFTLFGGPDGIGIGDYSEPNTPMIAMMCSDSADQNVLFKNRGMKTIAKRAAIANQATFFVNRTGGGIGDDGSGNGRYASCFVHEVIIFDQKLNPVQMNRLSLIMDTVKQPERLLPRTKRLFIFDGNSFSEGFGTTSARGWPSVFMTLLNDPNSRHIITARGGQATAGMVANFPTKVAPFFDPDRSQHVVSGWELTNSILFGISGTDAKASLVSYCNLAKAMTPTPIVVAMTGTKRSTFNAGQEAERQIANNLLLADFSVATADPLVWLPGPGITYADVLYDVGAEPNLQNTADTTYFLGDGVHFVDGGNLTIATGFKDALTVGGFI